MTAVAEPGLKPDDVALGPDSRKAGNPFGLVIALPETLERCRRLFSPQQPSHG
jgi:hypothetical protein